MSAPVLTPAGFVAPSTDEEVQDLNSKFLTNVDASLDLDPDQPWGQIIGIFAQKISEAYGVIATGYNAINPNAAEGQLLVNACALSGTIPQVATFSKVTVNLTLGASVTVHAGATMAVLNQPGNVWVLTEDVTSTSAGSYPGVFRSQNPGPFAANAGTLTVITSPQTGWTAGSNPAAAVAGFAADTDTTLRQRRQAELAGEGSGDVDAIRAALLKVEGVINAFVFENTTLVPDSNGLPGKAFRAVIWDGPTPFAANADIAATIWKEKPTGIQSFGSIEVDTLDSQGNLQPVFFERATQVPIYVTCTTTPGSLTADQATAVKAAIKAFADANWNLGSPVIARAFSASPLEPTTAYTPVVTDVPVFQFGTAPSPTNTANLTTTALFIFTLSTTNITVNGV